MTARITVIGAGAWGTALAMTACANGHQVTLWTHRPEQAAQMAASRVNPRLAGIVLPSELAFSDEMSCAAGSDAVIVAVPSYAMAATAEALAPHVGGGTILISATKGIEKDTGRRMSQILAQATGAPTAVLSGPSYADEVSRGKDTGIVAACADRAVAEAVQQLMMNEHFRVYTSPDTVGVELAAALKNIIALCAGVCDGLGCGDDTRALLMTRGLAETARLGMALGARRETFAGLAGMGDLIVTCTSLTSRNHRAGILIGQGHGVTQALTEIGAVVEGYYATASAVQLAAAAKVEMPITQAAWQVLYAGAKPQAVITLLMQRRGKAEAEQAAWAR